MTGLSGISLHVLLTLIGLIFFASYATLLLYCFLFFVFFAARNSQEKVNFYYEFYVTILVISVCLAFPLHGFMLSSHGPLKRYVQTNSSFQHCRLPHTAPVEFIQEHGVDQCSLKEKQLLKFTDENALLRNDEMTLFLFKTNAQNNSWVKTTCKDVGAQCFSWKMKGKDNAGNTYYAQPPELALAHIFADNAFEIYMIPTPEAFQTHSSDFSNKTKYNTNFQWRINAYAGTNLFQNHRRKDSSLVLMHPDVSLPYYFFLSYFLVVPISGKQASMTVSLKETCPNTPHCEPKFSLTGLVISISSFARILSTSPFNFICENNACTLFDMDVQALVVYVCNILLLLNIFALLVNAIDPRLDILQVIKYSFCFGGFNWISAAHDVSKQFEQTFWTGIFSFLNAGQFVLVSWLLVVYLFEDQTTILLDTNWKQTAGYFLPYFLFEGAVFVNVLIFVFYTSLVCVFEDVFEFSQKLLT